MAEKILVVDDEIETLRLVGLTLQRQGYQIIAASCGSQAIEMASSESPDLIVLDVMMPDMDGFEVARRLRADESLANIPILMFSARAQLDDKVTGYEAGADDYLTKPIHPAELVAHVKALISRSKERAGKKARQGYIIGVTAARGGMGTSTLALSLAVALQKYCENEAIAAELRPGHGSWRVESNRSHLEGLIHLLRAKPDEITTAAIENELLTTSYGLRLLLSSSNVKDIELFKATIQVESIIHQLSTMTPVLVLDIGTFFWPNYEKILSLCNEIVVVTEPQLTTLTRTRQFMEELARKGFGKSKAMSVALVERVHTETALPTDKVQDLLKFNVSQTIPSAANQAYKAEQMEMPLIAMEPDSLLSESFNNLASQISGRIPQ